VFRDRNDPTYRAQLALECGALGILDVPQGFLESEFGHCREKPGSQELDFAALYEKEAKLSDK
jgi:hypothetical protein